jgi:hypothetical protein
VYLPVKLAISVPVTLIAIGGIVFGLAIAEGRQIYTVYGTPNGLFIGFFAGAAALLLVPPNLVGAVAANNYGSGSAVRFLALLAMGIIGGWLIEALLLNKVVGWQLDIKPFADLRIIGILAADIALLAGVAAWPERTAP